MLLAIDIGNTNTTIGLFKNDELVFDFRLTTRIGQTMDEYGVFVRNLIALADMDLDQISGMIVSSVVPPLDNVIYTMSHKYLK